MACSAGLLKTSKLAGSGLEAAIELMLKGYTQAKVLQRSSTAPYYPVSCSY